MNKTAIKKLPHLIALISTLGVASLVQASSNESEALNRAYIEGFLAGAQLTDSEIIRRLDDVKPDEKYSDFFKRAFETRIGSAKEKVPATFYAGFCLPGQTEGNTSGAVSDEVITTILNAIDDSTQNASKASKASQIFQAVRSKYPCP
ncbi:MAG: hypothetical protein OIF57_08065 [Marinobacterium sp.]|nr:hypothetical protein [Marinobacterium sp.]